MGKGRVVSFAVASNCIADWQAVLRDFLLRYTCVRTMCGSPRTSASGQAFLNALDSINLSVASTDLVTTQTVSTEGLCALHGFDTLLPCTLRDFRWLTPKNHGHTPLGLTSPLQEHDAVNADAFASLERKSPNYDFEAMKAKHGVRVAYHGSSVENWHSICQNGLLNYSGTAFMKHGAAFGNGVYLAADPKVARGFALSSRTRTVPTQRWFSLGYAGASLDTQPPNGDSSDSSSAPLFPFEVVARCHVVDLPQYRSQLYHGSKQESDYFIVNDPSHLQVDGLYFFKVPPPQNHSALVKQWVRAGFRAVSGSWSIVLVGLFGVLVACALLVFKPHHNLP